MHRSCRSLVLTLSLVVCGAAVLAAQESCDDSPNQIPTLLTVEGGGSLGVYEAGMTWALVETFKRKWLGGSHPTYSRLPALCLAIATGASAGSINAFIAATNWCDARLTARPEESMFWRTWITTGIMQLLPARGEDPVSDSAVFARRHFDEYIEPRLRESWKGAAWLPDCHVEFGATATRLYADTLAAVGGIAARNQRMAFALTVRGIDTDSGVPIVRQFLPELRLQRGSFGSLNTLPPVRGDTVSWPAVFELLKVSSAFPVAFAPLELDYCTYEESSEVGTPSGCGARALALDGGVFDNAPLSLSYVLSFSHNLKRTATTMLFLTPDRMRRWPNQLESDVIRDGTKRKGVSPFGLEELGQLAGEMIPTARQYELQIAGRIVPMELFLRMTDAQRFAVAQQGSAAGAPAGRVDSVAQVARLIDHGFRATARWHPLTGDWLGGFGAFLGRPLREYDFYVGVYDALVLLAENILCVQQRGQVYFAKDQSAVASLRDCIAREVRALIGNPPMPTGDIAPRVLAALYHDEFERSGAPSPPRSIAHTASVADSSFVVVDAVREALYAVRVADRAKPRELPWYSPQALAMTRHCARPGLANALFCESKVVAFFDSLHANKQAFRIMERWAGQGPCAVRALSPRLVLAATNAWRYPDACRVEESFVKTARDPEGQLYELSRQVLGRLEDRTPRGGAMGKVSSALLYMHATVGDRHRREMDIGRSTIPVDAPRRTLFYMMPSSWGLTPNIRGLGEIGWELRRHLSTWPLALAFPMRVRPFSQIGTDGAKDHTLLVPGVRLEHKALFLSTRAGVQYDFWFRPSEGTLTSAYEGKTIGVFVSIFGKLNASWTGIPIDLTEYRKQNSTILTFGIGDLNGLAYWLLRK